MISLIVTFKDCEKYLGHAISSVLNQSFLDWELILFDDGSIDNSLAIAQNFSFKGKRIVAIASSHIGRPRALIEAIKLSSGDYIGFLDADDILHDKALETTCKHLKNNSDIGLVYTDYYDMSESGEVLKIGDRCKLTYSKDGLLLNFMTHHFRLMTRKVYDSVGGIDEYFECAQDYDLCLKISEITNIDHIHTPLYYYRKNPTGISQSKGKLQDLFAQQAVRNAITRRKLEIELAVSPCGIWNLIAKK
jgi:glycosyltransferase involved in cell wall biosynthesis